MSQSMYEGRRGGRDGERMRGEYDRDRDGGQRGPWQDRGYDGDGGRGRNGGSAYGGGGGGGHAEMRGPSSSSWSQRDRYEQSEPHEANIVKVIEVVAESERGWEDAAQKAVFEASRSVRNIKSIYIKDMTATVSNARITHYRLVAKISFAIEQ